MRVVSNARNKRCRAGLVPKITTKNVQSSQQSSDRSCFCTNTRTTHTRQNKPYRLGVVPAGVVGARSRRSRCCPAATVPVVVVFACGVCCCIAEEIQNKIIDRKTELCHHRPQIKAHSNEYENEERFLRTPPFCRREGYRFLYTRHLLRTLVGVNAETYGACCVALCGGLMLWCHCVLSFKMGGRCVLSFKMGFWVCGSRGVRDVHVISCTRVVQIRVAMSHDCCSHRLLNTSVQS